MLDITFIPQLSRITFPKKEEKCIEKTSLFSIHFLKGNRGNFTTRVLPGLTRHPILSEQ